MISPFNEILLSRKKLQTPSSSYCKCDRSTMIFFKPRTLSKPLCRRPRGERSTATNPMIGSCSKSGIKPMTSSCKIKQVSNHLQLPHSFLRNKWLKNDKAHARDYLRKKSSSSLNFCSWANAAYPSSIKFFLNGMAGSLERRSGDD